jgi:hypothetical protein
MGKKKWVEQWLDPNDELKEVEVDPDVFYDYFLSIPTVKCQRHFKEYKTQFLAKIQGGNAVDFAKDVGYPDDPELERHFKNWKTQHDAWKDASWKLQAVERKLNNPENEEEKAQAKIFEKESKALTQTVRGIEKSLTQDMKEHFGKVRNVKC